MEVGNMRKGTGVVPWEGMWTGMVRAWKGTADADRECVGEEERDALIPCEEVQKNSY